jgi:hypothetical protein
MHRESSNVKFTDDPKSGVGTGRPLFPNGFRKKPFALQQTAILPTHTGTVAVLRAAPTLATGEGGCIRIYERRKVRVPAQKVLDLLGHGLPFCLPDLKRCG